MGGAERAVDKMENAIQNILLQEMEDLDGILIATTNLTQNLDHAFERRFLYKVRFDQPDSSVREMIWGTMLPLLSAEDCARLASAYELSGGQIENIARKFTISTILYGDAPSPLPVLEDYCKEEKLESRNCPRIGF
jgi:SpoVK/Ycf46/Vps4 family AAA+-type ATPase